MTTSSRSRRHLLGGFAALALLTSLLAAVAVAPANAGAGYQKPTVGECRNLTFAQIQPLSDSTLPILCSQAHTLQTIATPKLPKKFWKSKKAALAAADEACAQPVRKAIGRSTKKYLMSAFDYTFFIPTKAQRANGARWVRCDILVLRGKSGLTPLSTTTAPFLSLPIPDDQALCLTGGKLLPTSCDAPHQYRADSVFKVHKSAYPGKKRLRTIAIAGCEDRVTTVHFAYDQPTKAEWNDGFKWVTCSNKTTG